ncbi:aspartate aminotransferase family protein [Salinispira pacifica]
MSKKDGMVHNPPLPRNFAPDFLVLEEGEGVYISDKDGNRYLDLGAGIAVNALGYGREDLAKIAYGQMRKLIHTSNLYTSRPTIELAERLVGSGPFAAVHFGSSGTEANEAALKYARLYSYRTRGAGHHRLLCTRNAFHGRTMGALSVTPNAHYQEPFAPLLPGVDVIPYNDVEALEQLLDDSFAAVIVEVVQGEGGLVAMSREFAAALNRLCRLHDVILIDDEVQTGIGRTGSLYASEAVGLEPDIVTLAKPLAAGLPLSATLIPEKINSRLTPGDHGTTFGGGPVTTAVAAAVWDALSSEQFIAAVRERGAHLEQRLEELRVRYPAFGRLRGMGLLRGLPVGPTEEAGAALGPQLLQAAREEGVLVLRSGKNVIRFAPPLVIEPEEIDEGIRRFDAACRRFAKELGA